MAGPLDGALSILGGGKQETGSGNAPALNYLNNPKNRGAIMADAERIAAMRPGAAQASASNGGALSGAIALLGAPAPQSNAPVTRPNVAEQQSFAQNVVAGIGHGLTHAGLAVKEALDMGANAIDSAVKGTAVGRAADWANEKLGLTPASQALANTRQAIADTKEADQRLMQTAGGKVGNFLGAAAAAAPTVLIPGANTVTGAALIGAGTGAALTEGDVADRAKAAAVGAAGGVAGKGLGDAIGWAAGKLAGYQSAKAAANATANAGKDAAIIQARKAGYRLPPTEIKPGIINSTLEGLSGKIKTSQAASAANQDVTNSLAKRALGVSDDVTLTPEVLNDIRSAAGKSYEAIKGAGTITADSTYEKALDRLVATYQGASRDFPGLTKPEVTNLVDSLRQPSFGADSAVDAIRVLRETADSAFRKGDTGVAKASKGAAQAMEDLVDRHLTHTGQPDLLTAYREARKTIAKTYDVERALNQVTGDVSAPILGGLAKKGKPLSGELKSIADAAQAFPRATQSLKQNPNAVSPLDFAVAGASALSSGRVADLLSVGIRPAVRSTILSRPYQAAAAKGVGNYGPSLLSTGVSKTLGSKAIKDFLRIGGTEAGVEFIK